MATQETIKNGNDSSLMVPINLPRAEWTAFTQFLKRTDYATCVRLAYPNMTYNGRAEGDVIWSAVCMVQRQLAEAGFAPR